MIYYDICSDLLKMLISNVSQNSLVNWYWDKSPCAPAVYVPARTKKHLGLLSYVALA